MLSPALFDVLLLPLELIAQAGGGGNYGGGGGGGSGGGGGNYGGGGGGGSGGGGGDGAAIYWLIQFTIRYPQFGIPLCIVIGFVVYHGKKTESDFRVTRTIRRGRKFQESALRETAIGEIQRRDPEFDQEVFLQRVVNGFVTTQHAWSEQDLRHCRAFVSDGVRERFELYIGMQKAENIRNRMKNVEVDGCEIVSVTSDQHFDTIHVRITASAISYNEDLTSGKRVSGNSDRTPITFTEIWSFSRRPGATTNVEASVLQGRCPNCGGPVKIVDKAECTQCQSIVNSGQYDWVLAEITQDQEWVIPPAQHSVRGWDKLQQSDPGLNFQHIEDRASVIFWRSMMAVYFDDVSYAAPVLDAQISEFPKLWAYEPGSFWKTPAVGVVEIVQCVPAGDDEFDRILVMVRWSATKAKGDRKKPLVLGHQRIYSHVLILKRRKGTTSNTDNAFASFSCSGCGAPIDVGGAQACGFCGSPLNDGSGDWVLEDVGPRNMVDSYRIQDEQEQLLQTPGSVERLEGDRFLNEPELLTELSRILTVDGELHDKERKHIIDLAQSRGVPKDRLKTIFATATSKDIPITVPQNLQQANIFMDHLLRAALVDGKVTRSEHQLLLKAGQQIGWSAADLKIALSRIRKELYQQAKTIIRERRRK
ncbi:MAG: TIM44-like domain-containing protein [Fuerstiella sp.]